MNSSSRSDWLTFLTLGLIWGSSYLFIKIGVDAGLAPLTLVMLRLMIGFALLAAVVAAARERLPRDARTLGHLLVMSVLNIALPFCLITVAEQSVDSSLAATIAAAIPLAVIPIAAVTLRTERITQRKVVGALIGFLGVGVLVGFDPQVISGHSLGASLALVASTISYAVGGVYARRHTQGLRPMIPALFQVGFAMAIVTVLAFVAERPLQAAIRPDAIFAVIWLGLLGSGVAYLLYFRLLSRWGATRTSTVSYMMPIVGIGLGAAVLAEPIDARLLVGAALIILGIVLVNRRDALSIRIHRRAAAPAAAADQGLG